MAKALNTTAEAIRGTDVEKMVFNFNHQNQQGNSIGYVNSYNAADEIVKAIHVITQPLKDDLNEKDKVIQQLGTTVKLLTDEVLQVKKEMEALRKKMGNLK